jgi:hypothetical protein
MCTDGVLGIHCQSVQQERLAQPLSRCTQSGRGCNSFGGKRGLKSEHGVLSTGHGIANPLTNCRKFGENISDAVSVVALLTESMI